MNPRRRRFQRIRRRARVRELRSRPTIRRAFYDYIDVELVVDGQRFTSQTLDYTEPTKKKRRTP